MEEILPDHVLRALPKQQRDLLSTDAFRTFSNNQTLKDQKKLIDSLTRGKGLEEILPEHILRALPKQLKNIPEELLRPYSTNKALKQHKKLIDSLTGQGMEGGQSFMPPEYSITNYIPTKMTRPMPISKIQAKKIAKAIQSGTGVSIKLTNKQLSEHEQKGGFAWLLPLLGIGASMLGSAMSGNGIKKALTN